MDTLRYSVKDIQYEDAMLLVRQGNGSLFTHDPEVADTADLVLRMKDGVLTAEQEA